MVWLKIKAAIAHNVLILRRDWRIVKHVVKTDRIVVRGMVFCGLMLGLVVDADAAVKIGIITNLIWLWEL